MSIRLFLSCLALVVSANAQTRPPVAFIGDNLTYEWQQSPQFQANRNWLPYGFATENLLGMGPGHGVGPALTELQSIIGKGQKPIIHLMVGQADADAQNAGGNQEALVFAIYANGFETIINTAQAAKLKIIVGLEPFAQIGDIGHFNDWTMQYCAAHNIPVVNYAAALGVGFYTAPAPDPSGGPPALPTLTPAGYALITDMAQTQIGLTSGAFTLTHGYLSATILPDLENPEPIVGGNSAVDGSTVKFTPYGQYSDGKTRIMDNVGLYGDLGTWTSSNLAVIWIQNGQGGVATAWGPGKANVKFTSPTGIVFNEWTMNVYVDDPCGCLEF